MFIIVKCYINAILLFGVETFIVNKVDLWLQKCGCTEESVVFHGGKTIKYRGPGNEKRDVDINRSEASEVFCRI